MPNPIIRFLDRAKETTTTTGSGTISLGGAVAGFVGVSGIGNGNSTYYTLQEGNNFEIGIGTYAIAGNTLSRDEVFSSSNSDDSKIVLAGSTTVFITYPADKAVVKTSGNYVGIGIDPEYQLQVSGTGSFNTVRWADGTTQTTADTDTTYTGGTGLSLVGTEFNVSGIDSTMIVDGTVANIDLANSSLTITAGTGLSNGGLVSLGSSVTVDADTASTSAVGVVQLQDSATDGTTDKAITPNAVYDVSGILSSDTAATGASNRSLIRSYIDTSDNATFNNLIAQGNLTVSGTLTYLDSTTVTIADKQLELASNSGTPIGNDSTVNDGGIVVKSTDSDKKWTWLDATDAWTSTENISLNSSKKIIFGDSTEQTTSPTGDIATVSGLTATNATNIASTGATNWALIATNTTNISTNTTNIASTGATNAADINTVSGLLYGHWKLQGDSATTTNIDKTETVQFTGAGTTTVTLGGTDSRTVTISGSDSDTTYTAGTGLSLVGTEFNVSGIDSTMIVDGTVANADLANSSLTITAGTGLAGGGSVSLGGTVTLDTAETGYFDKLGLNDTSPDAMLDIVCASAADIGLKIEMMATQLVNPLEIVHSDGTPRFSIDTAADISCGAISGSGSNFIFGRENVSPTLRVANLGNNFNIRNTNADKNINIDVAGGHLVPGGMGPGHSGGCIRFREYPQGNAPRGGVHEGTFLEFSFTSGIGTGMYIRSRDDGAILTQWLNYTGLPVAMVNATGAISGQHFIFGDGTTQSTASAGGSSYTAGTGLSLAGTVFNVSGIDSTMIVDGTVSNTDLANSSVSYGGISVSLGGSDATPALNLIHATGYLTSSLVGTVTNSQLAGSIANDKLTNSSITITARTGLAGGGSVSLGGTVTLDTAETGYFEKLGINDTSPGAMVDVVSDNANTVGLIVEGHASQAFDLLNLNSSSANLLAVDKDGFLGIGVDPSYVLHIDKNPDASASNHTLIYARGGDSTRNSSFEFAAGTGDTNNSVIFKLVAGTAGSSYIYFGDTDLVSIGQFRYQHSSNTLSVKTSSSNAVAWDGNQKRHDYAGSYMDIKSNSHADPVTFDLDESNIHTLTITADTTFAVSNTDIGQRFMIRVLQDGTGGHSGTWWSTIKWAGGTEPVQPTATNNANEAALYGFLCTSAANYDGFVIGTGIA